MRKTILLVSYGGGHIKMLVPLIRGLEAREDIRCVTFALTTAADEMDRQDLPYYGFSSIIKSEDVVARRHGERLCEGAARNGKVKIEESIAYLGLSYEDLEKRVGVQEAAEKYAEIGRQAFLPIGPMNRIFDEVHPDLVITTISPRAEEAAQIVARERGIPSICLVDLFARPSLNRAAQPGYGSRVCVLSEGVKEWLVSAGRCKQEISVTGNPAFDFLADPSLEYEARRLRNVKGWRERKVILWASQVEPDRNPFTGRRGDPMLPCKIEERLIQAVCRNPDWQLVIRPHPNEDRTVVPGLDRVELSGKSENLHVLLKAVDVVVVMTSTVGLEARLLGKPVVSVEMSVFSGDMSYADAGISHGVYDLDELEEKIEDALDEPCCFPKGFVPPGRATRAVLKEIDDLLMVSP